MRTPFLDQGNQFAHGRNHVPSIDEAFRIEPPHRLFDMHHAAVAGAREFILELGPHRAVVAQEVEGPSDRIVDQALANKNIGRLLRVDFAVTHRPRLDLDPIHQRALPDHHPAFILIPKRIAIRALQQMRAEIEHPSRIQPGAGPRIQTRCLHQLRTHQPTR